MLALLMAKEVVDKLQTVDEVTVYLLSQIGAPLDQPLVATAYVRPASGSLNASIEGDVKAILDEQLTQVHTVRDKIISRKLSLF